MTTNLNIQFKDSTKVGLIKDSSDHNKSSLFISLSHDIDAWDNQKTKIESFPTSDNSADNIKVSHMDFLGVEIIGPTKILTTIYNLFLLKSVLTENPQVQIVVNKTVNQDDHWVITDKYENGKLVLQLSEADFGGSLDISKVSIDDIKYENGKFEKDLDYSPEKDALLALEKLLHKTLPEKYLVKYSELLNFNFEKDIDLIDPSLELGKSLKNDLDSEGEEIIIRQPTGLYAYRETTKTTDIKYNLYNSTKEIKEEIDTWIDFLSFNKKFIKCGLRKLSQFSLLKEEGYENNNEEYKEIKKKPLFYKGFSIFDPNLEIFQDSSDNKFKVRKKNPDQIIRYTKKNIDIFRFPIDNNKDYYKILIATEQTTDNKGKPIEVFVNSDPQDCLGFQPGDIVLSKSKNNKVCVNTGYILNGSTKIQFDILGAQNAQEAMDLAFFGKDYEFARSDFSPANRKNNPKEGAIKTPNTNLKFDEVRGVNRLETLELYYSYIKKKNSCKWITPGDNAGNGATAAPKYEVDGSGVKNAIAQEIDNNHQLATEWIRDFEKWTASGFTFANLSEEDLKTAKTELEGWKKTRFYTSGGVWRKPIEDFLIEVDGLLYHHDGFKTELANLKTRGSELAQKICKDLEKDKDEFTKEVFAELKNLINLLDEAFGTRTDNTETNLKNFINDSNADKQKAVALARKVKNQDNDAEADCIETALERLKSSQQNKLEEARQKLKDFLTGLKIGEDEAYPIVVADIKDSETDLNKASEIFEKLNEIENDATKDANGELLNALNDLKNNTSNQTAWNAINKYKREGQSQGYADEMLKRLNDWAEQRRESHKVIKNAKTKSEFQAAKQEFIKKLEYRNNKPDYDEVYFPLLEKAAEIREKDDANQEEKDLCNVMAVILTEYTDWKTQLEELEEKFKKIKDYDEGGTKNNVIQTYSATEKQALKKLIHKMEEKIQAWRTEKNNSEHNNSSNPPWYKTTAGIVGIVLVTLAILAGVIYLFYQKPNHDQEEEQE